MHTTMNFVFLGMFAWILIQIIKIGFELKGHKETVVKGNGEGFYRILVGLITVIFLTVLTFFGIFVNGLVVR